MTTEAGRQAAHRSAGRVDEVVRHRGQRPDVRRRWRRARGRCRTRPAAACSSSSPIFAVIIAGILFAIFNAALGGEASFKQVFTVLVHAGAVSALSTVFSGIINYFRGGVGSAANLGALLPMLPEDSFVGEPARHGRRLPDLVRHRPGHRAGRAVPAAHAADRDFAARLLCGHRIRDRHRQEPCWRRMSRNKKILIGVGVVVVLGAIAFANFKFKRQEGIAVNVESDPEARSPGHRVRVGQDPAAAAGQHQRRHDGPGDGPAASRRGSACRRGSSSSRSIRAT